MHDNQPTSPGRNTLTIVARCIAIVVAGACAITIVVNLSEGVTTAGLGRRIVGPLGLILLSAGLLTSHDRLRLALAIGSALTVAAAVVLDVSGF